MNVEHADPTADTVHRSEIDDTTTALDALTAALDGNADLESVLQQACDQVTRVIAGSDLASVSPFKESTPFGVRTLACTSDLAYHLDDQQYANGDGPCLHAAATNGVVRGDLDETFDVLVRHSQRGNVKLRDVARQVVERAAPT